MGGAISCEFSRFLFHRCFPVQLRRSSAAPKASDGVHENDWFSQRPVCLEGYRWHFSDDGFVLSHARIVAAIRPELSLSIPRFERDLHYAAGSGSPKGKAKHATDSWRVADQRRDCACFNELELLPRKELQANPS